MAVSNGYVLGLDAGGGGGRCLAVNVETGEAVSAFRPWRATVAPATVGLGYDLDLEDVFNALGAACREAMEKAGVGPSAVLGIAAASMRQGSVVVDEEGRSLLATPNRDARAVVEAAALASDHGERLYELSGHWPLPISPASRLLWMQANRPADFDRAACLLSLSDWIAWRLCGEKATDPSQAGESLLFDVAAGQWALDMVGELDLPGHLFPQIVETGTRLGSLTEAAASVLGLSAGTPVAVGGADTQLGLLGAGAIAVGDVGAITGSSAPVQLVTESPLIDPQRRLWTGRHVVPGRWVLESNAGLVGEALETVASLIYGTEGLAAVGRLLAEAALAENNSGAMMSTVGVEVMNASRPRLPLGSITLSHLAVRAAGQPRGVMARAVVDGVAFGIRANLEQVLTAAAVRSETLHLAGGLTAAPAWPRLLADTTGKTVRVSQIREASALGAAMAAALAAGIFTDLEASSVALASSREILPDGERGTRLNQAYGQWQDLRRQYEKGDELASAFMAAGVFGRNGEEKRVPNFRPRILVTADMDEAALDRLKALGDVEYASLRDKMRILSGSALVEALNGFHVFITGADLVDVGVLKALPELRVVATCRSDAVNVQVEACRAFGIPVLNAPGRNAEAVADMTVAVALALLRKLPAAAAFMNEAGVEEGDLGRRARAFTSLVGRELGSVTVGLVGFGAVGREVARRLAGFGSRVLVADPYLCAEQAVCEGAELVEFDRLLAASDVVSLHVPATAETVGMIGRREFAGMRKGAFLINTARAGLVDESALVDALDSGALAGAALDVFAIEPPASGHPLLGRPNVVATPHIAGNTAEVSGHQGAIVAADLECLLVGRDPANVLNPTTLEGFGWTAPRGQPSEAELSRLESLPPPTTTDIESNKGRAVATTGKPVRVVTPAGPAVDVRAARRGMLKVLEGFGSRIVDDPNLTADQDLILHFIFADLGLDFHFGFKGDRRIAAIGAPASSAEVELRMPAYVFDGMFSGKISGMQAAMDGKLSFAGDAAKAMVLAELEENLGVLYRQACDEVGGLGDLLELAAPPANPQSAASGTRETGGGRASEIVEVVGELYASGLITATGGNVSARVEPGSEELWITPGQMFKGRLEAGSLVRIGLDGRSLDLDSRSPSSERLMHTAVYKAKPEAEAVIHCHAANATILANCDLPFLPISTEAAFFDNIPRIPFIMPGTEELAHAIGMAIGDGWAVMMKNHGLLVAGRSLRRAADMAEIIERSAEVMLGCWAVGKEPPVLPADVVQRLRQMGDLVA